MNEYELTYLIDPQANEEARGELNNAVDAKVNELAGAADYASPALRRKLAYPIKNNHSAFLRSIHFKLDSDKIKDFQAFLDKAEGVLRFTLLKTPRRQEISPELLDKVRQPASAKASAGKPAGPRKEQKKVTMKEVEKGIEEALSEEVK
jgi:ribosomal protein S6